MSVVCRLGTVYVTVVSRVFSHSFRRVSQVERCFSNENCGFVFVFAHLWTVIKDNGICCFALHLLLFNNKPSTRTLILKRRSDPENSTWRKRHLICSDFRNRNTNTKPPLKKNNNIDVSLEVTANATLYAVLVMYALNAANRLGNSLKIRKVQVNSRYPNGL